MLGGTRIRQRKRSINVPLDHSTFADEVVAIFQDAATEEADVETNLVRPRAALSPSPPRRPLAPSLPLNALTRPSCGRSSRA